MTQKIQIQKLEDLADISSLKWGDHVLIKGIRDQENIWHYRGKIKDHEFEFVRGYAPGMILSLTIKENVKNTDYNLKIFDRFDEDIPEVEYLLREAVITKDHLTHEQLKNSLKCMFVR